MMSLWIFIFIYIYESFLMFWMYLTIWNIVFFFWRYDILLISWNYQSQICLCLAQSSLLYISFLLFWMFLVICNIVFFFFFDDIIFHWYHEIANLKIWLCLSFNLHFHIYIYIIFSVFDVSHDMKYRLLLLGIQYFINIVKLPISDLVVSLSLFIYMFIYH